MADTDLTAPFQNISDEAKNVADKLKAARQGTREQLATDAANARAKASAAADELKDKAAGGQANASSQWQEIWANWQAHVTRVSTRIDKTTQQLAADDAAANAEVAEAYALHAIDFVRAAMDKAESAALDAISARATADALKSVVS